MRREFLILALLLSLAAGALAYEAWHLGLTADEPSHIAASYAWWVGADVLLPSDTPPLMRIISGWVPRAMRIPFHRETELWRNRSAYEIGATTISSLNPERAQRLIFFMRLPFTAFPLLIAFLLWRWGRELFGEPIGLTLAACGILEPTILGHGALIKSDVPAAFGALWFAYTAWRYWQRPCLRRLLVMTLATLIATLTKFTLLPLLAVALALALWRGPRFAAATIIPLTFCVATLASYQFQAAPVSPMDVYKFSLAGVPSGLMPAVRALAYLPWPDQWVRGLLYIMASLHGAGFSGYMLGHKIAGAVPAYYPLAWGVKFPIPLQILSLAGLVALAQAIRQRKAGAAEAFIWGSVALYFGSAVFSTFHIGFRHVLPALPFCILGGGFALARWGAGRAARATSAAALVWLAAASLHVYPQGISYFNEWIGGPAHGWKYLADSNLDWGQNLPELATFMEERRIPMVKTFLFGLDGPERHLKPGSWEAQPCPWGAGTVSERRLQPQPGFYAVSVNSLTGLLAAAG
ncbi:MAG: glycosyltransferase family 39 protein [Candidatus Solibacter sp.]|nr:glycosyltransferase family 39 protein [Candidatus Solibacter sp.]